MSAHEELAAAAVYEDHNGETKLAGHYVVNAAGHMVLVPREYVYLAADVERGVYVEGLGEGQRLATAADIAAKQAAAKE